MSFCFKLNIWEQGRKVSLASELPVVRAVDMYDGIHTGSEPLSGAIAVSWEGSARGSLELEGLSLIHI